MNIALFLSSDGVALAHRQPAGYWAMIGETAFDVPDLGAALADLRALAVEREGDTFETLLVLPDDQILYTSLTAPTADPELTTFRIEEGLEGLTPYAVTELEYDWCMLEQDRVKIAVVARETLDEARNFAAQYGFVGAGFAAMPPMERFPGVPTFELGEHVAAMGFTAEGIAFGVDEFGTSEPEAGSEPDPEPDPEPEAGPDPQTELDAATQPEDPADQAAEADLSEMGPDALEETLPDEAQAIQPDDVTNPATADVYVAEPDYAEDVEAIEAVPEAALEEPFAPDMAAPAPEASYLDATEYMAGDTQPWPETDPRPDPEPAPWAEPEPWPALEPESENAALADALMAANAGFGATDDAAPEAAALDDMGDIPVQPIEDPSLSGPIVPIDSEAATAGMHEPQDVIGDAGDGDDLLPPAPSAAAREARERARVIRGDGPGAAPRPSGDGGQFGATRGPIEAPDGARGALVGQRNSRLGFAHPDDPAPKIAAPDAAPGLATPAPGPATAPAGGSMPRLAEQLQRVRSASRTRPKSAPKDAAATARPRVEIDPSPALGQTGVSAERRPSPFDDPPPGRPATTDAGSKGASLAGLLGRRAGASASKAGRGEGTGAGAGTGRGSLLGRRGKTETPASGAVASEPHATPPEADETFTSGLLARKALVPVGGSFRTGLILTVILLVLLAIVAIWSAVFLPNSPVARLFGTPDVSSDVASASGLQAPDVVSEVPLIGLSGDMQPSLEDEAAADGLDLTGSTGVASDGATTAAGSPFDTAAASPGALAPGALAPGTLAPGALAPGTLAPGTLAPGTLADEALPDIDADLDLPPLPPIEQFENPTLEAAEALYSEDGIWARSPDRPDLRPFDLLDRVYTAAIDPIVPAVDAVALPAPGVNPGELLRRFPPPPPFGTEYDLTASGQIAPTAEGVITPEGAFVVSGQPPVAARQRPREVVTEAPSLNVDDAVLGTFRPAERPSDLVETRERQILGGLTETELGERRPAARPASPQEVAARASLFPGVDEAIAASLEGADGAPSADGDVVAAAVTGGTELAIARSLLPRTRPDNFAQIVASADRTPAEEVTEVAVAAESVAAGPAIPSNSDVSRAATERNVIRLRNVNLIGVTGTPSDRRALVRLSSGRFVRVGVGDRLDGGRVAAIGETTLQYVRSGRTVTLEIPG